MRGKDLIKKNIKSAAFNNTRGLRERKASLTSLYFADGRKEKTIFSILTKDVAVFSARYSITLPFIS
jgi:hypothetical protein